MARPDITLFTDLQLFAQGQWSPPVDVVNGISLKISGGVVDGNAVGSGTLFLSADSKSLSSSTFKPKTVGERPLYNKDRDPHDGKLFNRILPDSADNLINLCSIKVTSSAAFVDFY